MLRGLATVLLLVVSNAFMTLAWYGHIAFKSKLERFGLMVIVLFSWCIALFEYCFQRWNHFAGFLCLVLAVYFIFRK